MRWPLLLLLVAISRLAFAEPKVAVAPLDDDDGKVADLVADVAGHRAKVYGPKRVKSAMKSLGVSVLSAKTLKKLRKKLDADVVIYGSVERGRGDKRVSLVFAGKNGDKPKLEVVFKSTKQLRKELAAKLPRRIADAMKGRGGDDDEEDEDELRAKRDEERRRREDEDRRKREADVRKREEEARRERERREDEERERGEKRRRDDERRAKRDRDDDRDRRRDDDDRRRDRDRDDDDRRARRDRDDDRRARRDRDDDRRARRDRDDDDDRRARRDRDRDDRDRDDDDDRRARRDRDRDDDERDDDDDGRRRERHVLAQAALWLDAGGAIARRTLTYEATGTNIPPRVGTAAAAGRIEGEVYPAAFSTLKGPAAGFGISGVYSRTFGLGIAVPGTMVTAPIKNGHYSIGARYRFVFGKHSLAVGVSYWRRYYMADRSNLMDPEQLDMPDVDYAAIAPGATLRVAATPKIAAFGSLDLPLMLRSGPIQQPTSYGAAKILAFDLRGGAQIMIAKHAALQIAAEIDQVGLSFTGQPGSQSVTRAVTKATDRSIGLAATVGITY